MQVKIRLLFCMRKIMKRDEMDELPQGIRIVLLSLFLFLPAFIYSAPRVELQIAVQVTELPQKSDKPLQQGPTCTQAAATDFCCIQNIPAELSILTVPSSIIHVTTLCRGSEAGPGTHRGLSTPNLNSNPKLIL